MTAGPNATRYPSTYRPRALRIVLVLVVLAILGCGFVLHAYAGCATTGDNQGCFDREAYEAAHRYTGLKESQITYPALSIQGKTVKAGECFMAKSEMELVRIACDCSDIEKGSNK